MLLIDREMTRTEMTTDKSNTYFYCQASFNSDGNITLRNYDIHNKNSDEIIVLRAEETEAIVLLFKRLGSVFGNCTEMPF